MPGTLTAKRANALAEKLGVNAGYSYLHDGYLPVIELIEAAVARADARVTKFGEQLEKHLLDAYRENDATITPDRAIGVVRECVAMARGDL